MVDIAKLAIEVDASQATAAAKQLNTLGTEAGKAEGKAGSTANALGGMGRKAGQAGIQVQQLVGQIQGGVSPFVAFSQQAADLGFVLGVPLLGAVTAIAASFAGPLVAALTAGSNSLEGFNDRTKELRNSLASVQLKQVKQDIEAQEAVVASLNAEYDKLAESGVTVGRASEKLSEELDTETQVLDKLRETARELREEMRNPIETEFDAMDFGPDAELFYREKMRQRAIDAKDALAADSLRVQSRADSLKSIESLEAAQMTQQDKLTDNYLTQQYAISSALADGVIAVEEANALKLASDQQYATASQQITDQQTQAQLAAYSTTLSAMQGFSNAALAAVEAYGQESSDLGKGLLLASKVLSVAQAVMAAELSAVMTRAAYASAAMFAGPGAPAVLAAGEAAAQINRGLGYASAALIAATEFAPARALGGQVQAGKTYIWQENGTEYFMPGMNGYVQPNDKLGGKSAPVINVIEDASKAGTQEVQQMGEQDIINIFVSNIQRGGAAARAMQGAYGLRRAAR